MQNGTPMKCTFEFFTKFPIFSRSHSKWLGCKTCFVALTFQVSDGKSNARFFLCIMNRKVNIPTIKWIDSIRFDFLLHKLHLFSIHHIQFAQLWFIRRTFCSVCSHITFNFISQNERISCCRSFFSFSFSYWFVVQSIWCVIDDGFESSPHFDR